MICFGTIQIVKDQSEIIAALDMLAQKYSPNVSSILRKEEINGSLKRVAVLEFDIQKMSGKQAIELTK